MLEVGQHRDFPGQSQEECELAPCSLTFCKDWKSTLLLSSWEAESKLCQLMDNRTELPRQTVWAQFTSFLLIAKNFVGGLFLYSWGAIYFAYYEWLSRFWQNQVGTKCNFCYSFLNKSYWSGKILGWHKVIFLQYLRKSHKINRKVQLMESHRN